MTVHRGECPAIAQVRERLGAHHSAGGDATVVIVYLAVDALVDSFFPFLSDFDDRSTR